MAKTKQKDKGKGISVRRVENKKERQTGGFFTRLKTDEWLKAHALFIPDPEAEKNPGYYEYFEHYDKPNTSYVPCAGDDCYMCELGDNPSGRALTMLYFPENPEKEKFKLLKLNGFMIRDFAEIHEEEGGVLGKYFRIKRLTDDGKYRVAVSQDRKPLTKAEIKALLKEAEEAKLDLAALTLRQLKAALKKVEGANALADEDDDDDDDDDEDETPKARKGKEEKKGKKDEDDEDENDDDEDEEDDEDEDEDDEDESDDDDDEDDDEDDDDEDEDEDEDENDDDDEDDEDDDEDEKEDESTFDFKGVTVSSVAESAETVTVKVDGKTTKLWAGEGFDWDFDKVKKGATLDVSGVMDDEGDPVVTACKVKKAKDEPKKDKGKKGKGKK